MQADDLRSSHDSIDLGALSDHDLYALESQRDLTPGVHGEILGEIRRRRHSRRAPLADVEARTAAPGATVATLGDLERVSAAALAEMHVRLRAIEGRARALRWWVFLSPALWTAAGVAAVLWWETMR